MFICEIFKNDYLKYDVKKYYIFKSKIKFQKNSKSHVVQVDPNILNLLISITKISKIMGNYNINSILVKYKKFKKCVINYKRTSTFYKFLCLKITVNLYN